jgi:drug/metabolite transporter (DMT)-like permease
VRIEIAGLLGLITLFVTRKVQFPERRHWLGIAWMGLGLAIGYPLFVALALQSVSASHGSVVIGVAPAVTAVFAVLRTGERPPARFWMACIIGVAAVLCFAILQGAGGFRPGDGWLVLAMISVAIAYVEGSRVSMELGAMVTLCWAMIVLVPLAAVPLAATVWHSGWPKEVPEPAWAGLLYAGVISMFLGSLAWYRGLVAGGIARIGQLNLLQPILALVWSILLLHESVAGEAIVCVLVIVAAMTVCMKSRINGPSIATAKAVQTYATSGDVQNQTRRT